jgi:hypothetical protein
MAGKAKAPARTRTPTLRGLKRQIENFQSYQKPDYNSIILDLIHWKIERVAGWNIWDLPCDVLINFWVEIQKRECKALNHQNYSAAMLAAMKQTKDGEVIHGKQWQPFDLGDDTSKPQIDIETIDLLIELRDRDELPLKMLQDLYFLKIIPPG